MNKICSKCNETKHTKEYNRNGLDKEGNLRYKSYCKACEAAYKSTLPVFIKNKYSKIQARHRDSGREELRCDLTQDEFVIEVNEQLQWSAFTCPITDIKLTYKQGAGDTNLSVDRIDPNRGYTLDNMMVTSWLWNQMKSNNELKYMVRYCMLLKFRQPELYKKLEIEARDMFFGQSVKSRKWQELINKANNPYEDKEDKTLSQLLREGFEREQNEME